MYRDNLLLCLIILRGFAKLFAKFGELETQFKEKITVQVWRMDRMDHVESVGNVLWDEMLLVACPVEQFVSLSHGRDRSQ